MKNFKLFVLLMATSLMVACSEKEDKSTLLTVSTSQLEFSYEGGSQSFTVESNTGWEIVLPTDAPFISVSPQRGEGTRDVTVTSDPHPATTNEHYALVVRSIDGAKIVNIDITIKGAIFDDIIQVVTGNMVALGGAEHSEDLVRVGATVDWEMKGPEWIEAWDGSRWRPLSPTVGNITGKAANGLDNTTTIKVRAATANSDEETRTGEIVISQKLTGKLAVSVNVWQPGKHIIVPHWPVSVNNSVCTDWVCGAEVEEFYYCISQDEIPIKDDSYVLNNFSLIKPDNVCWKTSLKENQLCYFYTRAINKDGTLNDYSYYTSVMVPSSQRQGRAVIENVFPIDNGWQFSVAMNELAVGYMLLVYTNPDYFYLPDVYWAWNISSAKIRGDINPDDVAYDFSDDFTYSGADDIQIVTWAINYDGQFSTLLDRYVTSRDYKAGSRAHAAPWNMPQPQSGHVSLSELSKIKVKVFKK